MKRKRAVFLPENLNQLLEEEARKRGRTPSWLLGRVFEYWRQHVAPGVTESQTL